MTVTLDHILLGTPDLAAAAAAFADATGVRPGVGGTHPGFGTRNELVSLGAGLFFELIAPDPAQATQAGGRAAEIAALPQPAVLTFAVQTADLAAASAAAERAGMTVAPPFAMSRTRPDGVRLHWRIASLSAPGFPRVIPFVIDWQGSPHPSTTAPGGCTLRSFTALHPQPDRLAAFYRALGLTIAVQRGLSEGFVLTLDTPRGPVTFAG